MRDKNRLSLYFSKKYIKLSFRKRQFKSFLSWILSLYRAFSLFKGVFKSLKERGGLQGGEREGYLSPCVDVVKSPNLTEFKLKIG